VQIGLMVWELGERSFLEQFAWAADNGFDAVAFHTSPLLAPRRGIDPETMTPDDWVALKAAAMPFADVDIHAPFDNYDLSLVTPNERVRQASIEVFELSLQMANRLKANTVTLHPTITRSGIGADEQERLLVESLIALDETASALGVQVGLETTEHFDIFDRVSFESVGITVDVGHLSFHGGKAYEPWGSLAGLIKHVGQHIVHVHLHDYDGEHDHIPLGAGHIDFAAIVKALTAVGYDGALCLELAPSPTLEDGYKASRDLLRALLV